MSVIRIPPSFFGRKNLSEIEFLWHMKTSVILVPIILCRL